MKQIDKTKYKKATKVFNKLKTNSSVPMIDLELRSLGLNGLEIDLFWASSLETKTFLSCFKRELERL